MFVCVGRSLCVNTYNNSTVYILSVGKIKQIQN